MSQHKEKKPVPSKDEIENYKRCVAHVKAFLKRIDMDFIARRYGGIRCFEGVYDPEDGVVSTLKWAIVVGEDRIGLICRIPLRVPKPRRDVVARFANNINEESPFRGTLTIDFKTGDVSYKCDLPIAAIVGDPEGAMDDFFVPTLTTAALYADSVLETLMDAEVPKDEAADEPAEQKEAQAKELGRRRGAKRGRKAGAGPSKLTPDYSLDGLDIRSEVPLEQIVAAVARFSKTRRSSEVTPRLSILLSGPSGCGKSEFVKYLGERAGKEVVVVTASDVLRALVGETEQRIADVFREAAEKNAILFLDEVDSLLYDRKSAHYGWERVQTNELLIQMERFTGVLVCATNLVEQLDAAVMRRFTFKVQMAALDDDGKVKFFSRYFKSELSADERRRLLSIPNLTPGDFRTVRERLYFLAGKNGADNARRIAALEVESAAKRDSRAHIGFA